MTQVDAIKHEVRSLSFINPGPLTRSLDNLDQPSILNGIVYIDAQFNRNIADILYNRVIICCCIYRLQETGRCWGESLNIVSYQGLMTTYRN